MSKNNTSLMIVESPAKARTIGKLLGSETKVLASMGHVSDLPSRSLGVDIEADFAPQYELTVNGRRVMKELKEAAKKATNIYLATDPDREGEAISWHLERLLRSSTKGSFHRISYHEITLSAINEAFANPSQVSQPLVDAQQARRILDRLVGYQVSPMLWHNVCKDTSAGRVQSVALRLIVEREREISAFVPVEYWTMEASFLPGDGNDVVLKTRLAKLNGKKANITCGDDANALAAALQDTSVHHYVSSVTSTKRMQHPAPPFITSTLQQAAGSALHFGTSQTMKLAQELYEGVELANGNITGLITYMRTDSVNIAAEAQKAALDYIGRTYGSEYLPPKPNRYRSGKSAQEAHEAIRPTSVERTPDSMAPYLTSQQLRLYTLIWNRFVASQMASARQVDHAIEITSAGAALDQCRLTGESAPAPHECIFRAAARETVFPGYLAVYSMKDIGQEDEMDNLTGVLPDIRENTSCRLQLPLPAPQQCFTQPPGHYSEASLVKALESNGVGRPSTFASIVKTILDRGYVEKQKSALLATELGYNVNDYLVGQFPSLFDVGFTAQMEGELDEVEEGTLDWVEMLRKFYGKFQGWLSAGGAGSGAGAVTQRQCSEIAALFPDDYTFDAPTAKGGRVYDDAKFVKSLRKQIDEGKRPLSERQCGAMLAMLARYASRDAALMEKADAAGYGAMLQNQIAAQTARESNAPVREERPVSEALSALLAAMKDISWEKPVKRGKRTYDDGKFFRSITKQVAAGGLLSEAQENAVLKLARKYAAAVPAVNALLSASFPEAEAADATHTDNAPAAVPAADNAECLKLFEFAGMITAWRPASKRGKRVYDDQAFVSSLREQYEHRKVLSDRQLTFLKEVLGRYAEQLPEEAKNILGAGSSAAAAKKRQEPETLDEKCPMCGAPLQKRFSRVGSRPFVGCSGYPKCKFTRKIDAAPEA